MVTESREVSPPPSSAFDYLYEFSETRKVLEEFFRCPAMPGNTQLGVNDEIVNFQVSIKPIIEERDVEGVVESIAEVL